jgi:Tfp pilus assembly protein PilF
LRSAVAGDPCNSEKRFRYANLLWRLGRDEEAGREFEATILHPETLCPDCARDCCNNLGWYLYRKGEYAKALPWFERAARTRNFSQFPPGPESPVPFENIILVYAALNMATEAEEATLHYISRFGRLPWPERRALQKLNINADALFIEQCGRL